MTPTYVSTHDRARALSHSKGISLTAAYSEMARRSGQARKARNARRKRSLGHMEVTAADFAAVSGVEGCKIRLPYSDN